MATRDLTAAYVAALALGTVRPALFYEGEFIDPSTLATTYVRFWTGLGTITWDAKAWTGAGHLLAISPIEEAAEIRAVGFSVTLSGQPVANMAIAEEAIRSGRPGKVWLGVFDASGALIVDPYMMRRGRLDQPQISDDGATCTISVRYEDRLAALETPRERRWTPEDQKIDYPADLGFDYVQDLQDATFV